MTRTAAQRSTTYARPPQVGRAIIRPHRLHAVRSLMRAIATDVETFRGLCVQGTTVGVQIG